LTGYYSDFTTTTYLVTSGISPGSVFRFRVRGKNMWGWGSYSAILDVTPSAAPAAPAAVATSVELGAGDVVFDWTAPDDNSAAITAYRIEI
jgi:hypothetical protein